MAAPAVTVIVVNHNAGAHLAAALAALDRQTFADFELLLVDNASTDASLGAWPAGRPGLLRMNENLGFAAANNRAAEQARGRYLALLNPDAVPEPDWLARLVDAAEAHPEAAAFGSRLVLAADPALLDGTGDIYAASGDARRRDHRAPVRPRPDGEIFGACAAAALYRRDAFDAVGGFDEDLFCYLEDVDLAFRLRLAGWRCRHVDAAVVRHVGGVTSGGAGSAFAVYHGQRNLVWVYVANMPGWLFWRHLPAHLGLNLAMVAWHAMHGRLSPVLAAKRDALHGLPRAWAKRRRVQAARSAAIASIAAAIDRRPFPLLRRLVSRSRRSAAGTTG